MSDIRKTDTTSGTQGVVYNFGRARARTAPPSAASADTAGISEDARTLARAQDAVERAADVRAARVNALRSQIARGDYHPDPREVARKILERGL
ncbi:MAG: flagellar biosynthesis anti-sigma factor FlgM [Dehalococcoidia bacterium]|nr:flagellar biosynthesis anti-sigma factor FlgM [Dehalococcoidia bacterium]